MPKAPKNQLTIEPVYAAGSPGQIVSYRMFGYILGQKIRERSRDLAVLEQSKAAHMKQVQDDQALSQPRPVLTFLTADQVREAEALFREFKLHPRPVAEYARAGLGVLGSGTRIKCTEALELWKSYTTDELRLEPTTISANETEAKKFIAFTGAVHLDEITTAQVESYGSLRRIAARDAERGPSIRSKIGKLARLRAWFNFCISRKLILRSPFEVDMKALHVAAKHSKERTRVLTVDQCDRLLATAIEEAPQYVPYIVLACWCFMRHAEVMRMTPDRVFLDRTVPFVEPDPKKRMTAAYRKTNVPANVVSLLRQCIDCGLWPKGESPAYSQTGFFSLRAKAGLMTLAAPNAKGYRCVIESNWQENILRHTGISCLYQFLSDKADRGEFKEDSVIAAVTRQAGNSAAVAFEHYINLLTPEDAARFYAISYKLPEVVIEKAKERRRAATVAAELTQKDLAHSSAQMVA